MPTPIDSSQPSFNGNIQQAQANRMLSFFQNSFTAIEQTLSGFYRRTQESLVDENPLFIQAQEEPGFRDFQSWSVDLRRTIRESKQVLEKGAVDPVQLRTALLESQFQTDNLLTCRNMTYFSASSFGSVAKTNASQKNFL